MAGKPMSAANAPGSTKAVGILDASAIRTGLLVVSVILMFADLAMIFMRMPVEQSTGNLFLIFYFHVPIAIVSFVAFFVTLCASVLYLISRKDVWDSIAHASAEIGVLCISLVLITGSIWAKPANGVWWTWDPRLTTSLILWLIYVGYLMVRAYAATPNQGARFAAVVGIVGFIDVPIVYLSAVWWRNAIHPNLYLGPLAPKGALNSEMALGFLFSFITFVSLFLYLLWERASLRMDEIAVKSILSETGP